MITRKQKEEIVSEIKKKLSSASFIGFVNFHNMSVAKASEFRRALRKQYAGYMVGKKTLFGVAAKSVGLELDQKKLQGEVGVVFGGEGEDAALGAAKEIATFARKNAEILKIVGGFWSAREGGKGWIAVDEVKRLAAIPSREVLLTQLAYMLTQPVASLARVLIEVSKKVEK